MRHVDDIHGFELWVSEIKCCHGYEWAVILFFPNGLKEVDLGGYEETFDQSRKKAFTVLKEQVEGRSE